MRERKISVSLSILSSASTTYLFSGMLLVISSRGERSSRGSVLFLYVPCKGKGEGGWREREREREGERERERVVVGEKRK